MPVNGDPLKDDGLQTQLPDAPPLSAASPASPVLPTGVVSRNIQQADPQIAALTKRIEGLELHRRALVLIAVVACVASVTSMYIARAAQKQGGGEAVRRLRRPREGLG
jgi:hypothetical protein